MSYRSTLKGILAILGPCVLLSYYIAAQYNTKGIDALWGNIPENIKVYYPIGMLVATVGFFPFTYMTVFKSKIPKQYIIPYLLILIPSILWMPLTVYYINHPNEFIWICIRIVLMLVALGAILIYLRMKKEFQADTSFIYKLALFGVFGFIGHTLVLDGLLWPYFFK